MTDAAHLLFLTSYAPSTERPRAYNILRGLARHFRVSLIAQVRSTHEQAAAEQMREYCDCVEVVRLSRARAWLNCLLHLSTRVPLRAAYFFNPRMRRAIARRLASEQYDLAHAEHMMAAHFAVGLRGVIRCFDTIDSIARLQEKILRRTRGAWQRVLSLEELPKLRRYESRLCRQFDCVLTSTEADRRALRAPNVRVVPNGVDLDYYKPLTETTGRPSADSQCETVPEPDTILFYGRLSYVANADAAVYLLRKIFPRVVAKHPTARLLVVGPSPPRSVRAAASSNIAITGRVDDVRPHLRRACVVVCPMRFAVGTQNKILEPMAMGIPVVTTSEAITGMLVGPGHHLLVGDDPETFARPVVRLLRDPDLWALIAANGLEYVRQHHDWRGIVDDLAELYTELIAGRVGAQR